jgi:hypothetical protein
MLFEVDVPLHPGGNVHVYDVAPGEEAEVYVCVTPLHTAVVPLMVVGAEGVPAAETASALTGDVPQ